MKVTSGGSADRCAARTTSCITSCVTPIEPCYCGSGRPYKDCCFAQRMLRVALSDAAREALYESRPSVDIDDIRALLAYLSKRAPTLGACYRCWQIGLDARATCIVLHAQGTGEEWKALSCESCAERDSSTVLPRPSRVIARLLTGS